MARSNRQAAIDLNDLFQELEQQPYAFDFFAALRRIECLNRDKPRIGYALLPKQDAIRLGQEPSLKFAPASLARFQTRANAAPLLRVYFMGLLGPNGPLPIHLTEYIYQRQRHAHDPVPAAFLDLFHHRLLSLFYRAWADAEPTVQQDRPEQNQFHFYMASLCGLGTDHLLQRDAFPDEAKLHFAAYLGGKSKSPEHLAAMIRAYFQIEVEIIPFIGEWLDIPEDSLCAIHAHASSRLGQNCIIGQRSWQRAYRFKIQLQQLNLEQYLQFLPDGEYWPELIALVRQFIGLELHWDLNLILKTEEVPPARLGQSRLGWTTWLQNQPRQRPGDELILYIGSPS